MEILIATNNQGKLKDYRQALKGTSLKALSLKDLNIFADYEEYYESFQDNAKGKAEFYYKLNNVPTLADDSGMEIPYYNMEPGVRTKRWAGEHVSDQEYFNFILEKIKQIPENQRQAQLRAVLTYYDGKDFHFAEGKIDGHLTEKFYTGSTTAGYPWDKVFIIDGLNKYYEELTEEENKKYNHRLIAFEKLKPYILQ